MKNSGKQRQWYSQNLGFNDRLIRSVIGTLMIATPMVAVPETLGLWSISIFAAIPVMTSAIIGWDPLYTIMNIASGVTGEEDIQQRNWSYANVGIADRVIRLGAGFTMLYALLTMSTMTAGMALTLVAIPLIVTAITAWDPLYAVLQINSFGSRTDVEAAEPEASEQTLAACFEFPQPARDDVELPRAA